MTDGFAPTTIEYSFVTQITLRDGRQAMVRPLEATDVEPLTAYFLSLSPDTRRRYGPHPFDRATAERLCASINNDSVVRFIAVLNDGSAKPEIVGYMILSREISADDQKRYGSRLRLAHRGAAYAACRSARIYPVGPRDRPPYDGDPAQARPAHLQA